MNFHTPARFEDGNPALVGGLRRRHEFATAELGIAQQWAEFMAGGAVPGRIGQNLYGVICGSDSTSIEYLCGVEVASLAGLPQGMGRLRIPAQRYAVFAHDGPALARQSAWQQILAWLANGDYESAHTPDFELYGPHADPLVPCDRIELWVGVVRKRGNA